ncbi:separase/separin [Schizosaccharomyces pombe]|uniref:Separin n=1 Tax=Schizosaccharomyces pombe (strain 972 / ATCC 24843) TaxID=284812 RepID=CUT1_SCHPO|nr:separase/separin [Schizosaccharomyces pombe]P18296.3 RecName: Full=Separin; AltName: Full=Cell untimely torn protein 1; AltName: Full=Separase [Schizosaccharomyces pombe 972h-]CAA21959.1 separase/separin [Schizosaccharomyces pombe]|eukprot:NP_587903.1 separase/separin [Schizosaccharomyces pombe]
MSTRSIVTSKVSWTPEKFISALSYPEHCSITLVKRLKASVKLKDLKQNISRDAPSWTFEHLFVAFKCAVSNLAKQWAELSTTDKEKTRRMFCTPSRLNTAHRPEVFYLLECCTYILEQMQVVTKNTSHLYDCIRSGVSICNRLLDMEIFEPAISLLMKTHKNLIILLTYRDHDAIPTATLLNPTLDVSEIQLESCLFVPMVPASYFLNIGTIVVTFQLNVLRCLSLSQINGLSLNTINNLQSEDGPFQWIERSFPSQVQLANSRREILARLLTRFSMIQNNALQSFKLLILSIALWLNILSSQRADDKEFDVNQLETRILQLFSKVVQLCKSEDIEGSILNKDMTQLHHLLENLSKESRLHILLQLSQLYYKYNDFQLSAAYVIRGYSLSFEDISFKLKFLLFSFRLSIHDNSICFPFNLIQELSSLQQLFVENALPYSEALHLLDSIERSFRLFNDSTVFDDTVFALNISEILSWILSSVVRDILVEDELLNLQLKIRKFLMFTFHIIRSFSELTKFQSSLEGCLNLAAYYEDAEFPQKLSNHLYNLCVKSSNVNYARECISLSIKIAVSHKLTNDETYLLKILKNFQLRYHDSLQLQEKCDVLHTTFNQLDLYVGTTSVGKSSVLDNILKRIFNSLTSINDSNIEKLLESISYSLLKLFFKCANEGSRYNASAALSFKLSLMLHEKEEVLLLKTNVSCVLANHGYNDIKFEEMVLCVIKGDQNLLEHNSNNNAKLALNESLLCSWENLLCYRRAEDDSRILTIIESWTIFISRFSSVISRCSFTDFEINSILNFFFCFLHTVEPSGKLTFELAFLEIFYELFNCLLHLQFSKYLVIIGTLLSDKYMTLGFSGKAHLFYTKCYSYLRQCKSSPFINFWNVSYGKYLILTGNTDKGILQLKKYSLSSEEDFNSNGLSRTVSLNLLLYERIQLSDALFQLGYTTVSLGFIMQNLKVIKGLFSKSSKEHFNGGKYITWRLFAVSAHSNVCAARIYEHMGQAREAEFFYRQACSISEKMPFSCFSATFQLRLCSLLTRAGKLEKGEKILFDLTEAMKSTDTYHKLLWNYGAAEVCATKSELDGAICHYSECVKLLEIIKSEYYLFFNRNREKSLTKGIKRLSLSSQPTFVTESNTTEFDDWSILQNTAANLLRLISMFELKRGNLEIAKALMTDSTKCSIASFFNIVSANILKSKLIVCEADSTLFGDPVLRTLPDSVISLPGISHKFQKNQSKTKALGENTGFRKGSKRLDYLRERLKINLQNVRLSCEIIFSNAYERSSVCVCREVNELISYSTIMQSALTTIGETTDVDSSSASFFLEIPKALGFHRRREAQKFRNQHKELHFSSLEQILNSRLSIPDVRTFQDNFIDSLPSIWNVVSITINNSGEDLFISKIRKGHSPLIFRLPLQRHNSRDADEEILVFTKAQTELFRIISKSNQMAQNGKHYTRREDKETWWKERRHLDQCLQQLLENIEISWLGGFKGIFNPHKIDTSLFAKFSSQFQNIIAKNFNMDKKTPVPTLSPEILELFITLGKPGYEGYEQLLEDLIYFILDIFQFRGLHFAYDEIDTDQLSMDLQDALNAYFNNYVSEENRSHTVLVLDKSVHQFPWESLPCLNRQSVSRVPSLSILRDILSQSFVVNGEYVEVRKEAGSYILNPSLDLKHTQEMFEHKLVEGGWKGLIASQPSNRDFIKMLSGNDFFLYFGHGGGEQYTTSYDLATLKRCAVTILMGCSSGALYECGSFEPWGTPLDYLSAGCPTLVANLWDVTDKDIDRFSLKMLESWGLFENKAPFVNSTSICTAVSESRSCCHLRYLNGAAPVIYGIPAYIIP